ncbi:MAG TPA: hypothetical protein VGD56_20090, partial [Gemmatirosa sp.]
MFTSIRARLTAWYAGAFAVFELVFAVAGYAFVARATESRVDEDLARTGGAVTAAFAAEQAAGAFATDAVTAVMHEFRLNDAAVAVLDRETGVVVFGATPPRGEGPPDGGRAAGWRRLVVPPAPADFGAVLL